MDNISFYNLCCPNKSYFKYCHKLGLHKDYFPSLTWGGVDIKRRSKTDIAEDILKVAMKGAKKSHIVYDTNISFNIASDYLEMLNEKELIRQENGIFITTDKGKAFWEISRKFKL